MSSKDLAALYHQLEATQLLHWGAPGYDRARELTGIALVAEGRGSQRYLIVGVTGGQVSNDHHPYYEFLFRVPGRGADLKLVSHHRAIELPEAQQDQADQIIGSWERQ